LPFNPAISFRPGWQDSFSIAFVVAEVTPKQKNYLLFSGA
jgi:hypothetical protein